MSEIGLKLAQPAHGAIFRARGPRTAANRPTAAGTLPQDRGPWTRDQGARCRHQDGRPRHPAAAAAARPPAGRTSCAGPIKSIKGNRPPAGAGSREILRQLSATDQAPGAGHQGPGAGTKGPGAGTRCRQQLSADQGPGTRRTGPGITTPGQRITGQGPRALGQVSGQLGHQLQGSHQDQGNPRRPWPRTSSATRAPAWYTAGNKKPGQVAGFGLQLRRVTSRRVRQLGPAAPVFRHIVPVRRRTVAPGCSLAKRCPGRNRQLFASPGR